MTLEFESITKKKMLTDLINRQRKTIPIDRKLQYRDMCRIVKYVNSSIFDEEKCCIWTGYVTNLRNAMKGTYINFYFRDKKVALHRLLYDNYVEEMHEDDYLKFSCDNKGMCCNINHLVKYKYISTENVIYEEYSDSNNEPTDISPGLLTITFD